MRKEYDTSLDLQEKLPEATRQDTRDEFKIPKSRLQKTDKFFPGAKSLYNLVIRCKRNQFVKLKLLPIKQTFSNFTFSTFTFSNFTFAYSSY